MPRTCEACASTLDHLRADARYCSPACASEARRRREKAPNGDTADRVWVKGYWRRKPAKPPQKRREKGTQ